MSDEIILTNGSIIDPISDSFFSTETVAAPSPSGGGVVTGVDPSLHETHIGANPYVGDVGGEVLSAETLAAMVGALSFNLDVPSTYLVHPMVGKEFTSIYNLSAIEIVGVLIEIDSEEAFKSAVKTYEGQRFVAGRRMNIGGFEFTTSPDVPKDQVWLVDLKKERYVKVRLKFLETNESTDKYSFQEEEDDSWYDPRQA
jgi:hypothetical protein